MSVVVKTRRGKQRSLSTTALWLLLGLATIFFLVIYGQQLLQEHTLKDQIGVQRVQNSELQDSNTRLKVALQYYQSDKYIEQRAREDLNLRRDDEEVLIPVSITPTGANQQQASAPSGAQPSAQAPSEAADKPYWEKWLELFIPAR